VPKKYSPEFLIKLNTFDEERLGVQLAKACVNADLPITEVAKVFGVSRMTMHSWFRGSPIRDKNCIKIKQFMKALDEVWENQLEHNTSVLPITEPRKAAEFLAINIMSKIG
jgi:hypothetical protein